MMRDTTHPVGITITNHGGGTNPVKIEEPKIPPPESEETKTTGRFQGVKDYITNKADTLGDYAIGTGTAISAVGLPQVGGALATAGTALKAVPKANEIYESGKRIVSSAREIMGGKSEIQPDWEGMTRDEVRDSLKKMGKYQGKSALNKEDLVKYAKSLG